MNRRKNLVVVRAGDASLHQAWLTSPGDRDWDIVVNYFGDDPHIYREEGVLRIDGKGPKWPALHGLFLENPNLTDGYKYIWLPDDDLMTSKRDINKLFESCESLRLEVAQPALTWDSYYSHLVTLKNTTTYARYTNWVEVMAPCFSARAFSKIWPVFAETISGYGLDSIWGILAGAKEDEVAIIDDIAVKHTRPVGGPNYAHLKASGLSPWREMETIRAKFNLDGPPEIKTFKAILSNGEIVTRRDGDIVFDLKMIAGWIPAMGATPTRRRLARRLLGATAKAILKKPDLTLDYSTPARAIPTKA